MTHRVERHVPQRPYTSEVEVFDRLKRQLAAYRVVFGQPRQEELLTLPDRAGVDAARPRDRGGGSLAAGDRKLARTEGLAIHSATQPERRAGPAPGGTGAEGRAAGVVRHPPS